MKKQRKDQHVQTTYDGKRERRYVLSLTLSCFVIVLSSCVYDSSDNEEFNEEFNEEVTSSEDAIIVGPVSLYVSCEDRTSGGGQRVTGSVNFLSGDLSVTATAKASNWIKVLGGWVLKRTTQLRIIGTITAVSLAYGTRGHVCTFDEDTGGTLLSTIIRPCTFPKQSGFDGYDIQLSFLGRDGTHCSP